MSMMEYPYASTPREGFLCPVCLDDLKSHRSLQNHFEAAHFHQDSALVKNIKGMFLRAKDKIFSRDWADDGLNTMPTPFASKLPQVLDACNCKPQETGVTRHYMGAFRHVRDTKIDKAVVESNKLSNRLGKIVRIQKADENKQRELEKKIVPWVPDEHVPFCVICGRKFSIIRRRHHCRLCGTIMCARCSLFLEQERVLSREKQSNQMVVDGREKIVSAQKGEEILKEIRICLECDSIIHRSWNKLNFEFTSSLLVKLHEKMMNVIETAEKLHPEFLKMAESLSVGEEEYKLDEALDMRQHLVQVLEMVDVLSKKIFVYLEDGDAIPSPGTQKLQCSIRKTICAYLQDRLLKLPSLPSAQKLLVLQSRKHAVSEKQLKQQRGAVQRLQQEQGKKQELETRNIMKADFTKTAGSDGFSSFCVKNFNCQGFSYFLVLFEMGNGGLLEPCRSLRHNRPMKPSRGVKRIIVVILVLIYLKR